jgi:catechol 2,3-dioxygenase-like lactoylglutathione lyase family enzyme
VAMDLTCLVGLLVVLRVEEWRGALNFAIRYWRTRALVRIFERWWCGRLRVGGADLVAGVSAGEVERRIALVRWVVNIEEISAVTLKVASMRNSVRFYRDVLGMKIIYGGEDECFSSFRTKEGKGSILNLEQGPPAVSWGRLIFYVADVDALWAYLREKGFHPETPQDAPWRERYFHMPDPDGHELSFAHPLRHEA